MEKHLTSRKYRPVQNPLLGAFVLHMIILCYHGVSYARDFSGSVQSLGGDIRNIIMVIGPLMLAVAGAVFYFSKQQGVSMLVSALIGTVVTAASSTIFLMLYRAFN